MPMCSPPNTGRSHLNAPISTTSRAAARKIRTDVFAVGLRGASSATASTAFSFTYSGSFSRC